MLSEKIVRNLNSLWPPGYSEIQALNQVIGAMIAHDSRQGGMPYAGIDVERVFSAIKMLAEKDSLEIAPFVGSWTDRQLHPPDTLPSLWGTHFKETIGQPSWKIEKAFREGVRALTSPAPSPSDYRSLMTTMLRELRAALKIDDLQRFDYLAALTSLPQPVRVATLNYDLGVEVVAATNGLDLDRGVELWDGGLDWMWRPDSKFRLLKLHGSLDWSLGDPDPVPGTPYFKRASPTITIDDDRGWTGKGWTHHTPGIVFGVRDKLRAEGPFLAMLHELSNWLRDTDHLIVVGYSFRDDHINVIIRDWLQYCPRPHLSIIDPNYPTPSDGPLIDAPKFTRWLIRGIYRTERVELPDGRTSFEEAVADGFDVYRTGAASALPLVCQPRPDLN